MADLSHVGKKIKTQALKRKKRLCFVCADDFRNVLSTKVSSMGENAVSLHGALDQRDDVIITISCMFKGFLKRRGSRVNSQPCIIWLYHCILASDSIVFTMIFGPTLAI